MDYKSDSPDQDRQILEIVRILTPKKLREALPLMERVTLEWLNDGYDELVRELKVAVGLRSRYKEDYENLQP